MDMKTFRPPAYSPDPAGRLTEVMPEAPTSAAQGLM
jgi:hypothetical protein